MARAQNKVISGDYQGKLVGGTPNNPFISLSLMRFIFLNSTTVESVILLDADSQTSVASAAVRGFVGEMLLGPVGLAAAVTAKQNSIYLVGVQFKDGKRSVLEVDDKIYKAIIGKCF